MNKTKINIEYNVKVLLDKALGQILHPHSLEYEVTGLSTVEIKNFSNGKLQKELAKKLKTYGIEVVDSHQQSLVSKIKKEILAYLIHKEIAKNTNLSDYLSERLGYSYAHLSAIYADTTLNSIENFVILKRIDVAKQMLMTGKYTLTEVAFALRFSNVSHLSSQFKKVTGLTPSTFVKIIKERFNSELEKIGSEEK